MTDPIKALAAVIAAQCDDMPSKAMAEDFAAGLLKAGFTIAPIAPSDEKVRAAVNALLNYSQADADGVIVFASRQAIHVVSDALEAALAERDTLKQQVAKQQDYIKMQKGENIRLAWEGDAARAERDALRAASQPATAEAVQNLDWYLNMPDAQIEEFEKLSPFMQHMIKRLVFYAKKYIEAFPPPPQKDAATATSGTNEEDEK
jgi:predicted CoA-binding protein